MESLISNQEKYESQKRYCELNKEKILAPEKCFFCDKSPFERYSILECMSELITKCSLCEKSFLD